MSRETEDLRRRVEELERRNAVLETYVKSEIYKTVDANDKKLADVTAAVQTLVQAVDVIIADREKTIQNALR